MISNSRTGDGFYPGLFKELRAEIKTQKTMFYLQQKENEIGEINKGEYKILYNVYILSTKTSKTQ